MINKTELEAGVEFQNKYEISYTIFIKSTVKYIWRYKS